MKTKSLIYAFAIALTVTAVSCSQGGQKETKEQTTEKSEVTVDDVTISASDSRVIWRGEMLGIYSHEGTLDLTEASLMMNDGKITGGSFVANLNSMVPTDDNYNPEEGSTPEKLVGHLKSPDFFDTENYPTAKFEITKVEGTTAMGMFTVRGITNEEKVENIAIKKEGNKVMVTGDLVFDRKKYDVSWDSPVADRVLSSDIEVKIELVGS